VEFHRLGSANQKQVFAKAGFLLAEQIEFVVQRGVVWIECGATYKTN